MNPVITRFDETLRLRKYADDTRRTYRNCVDLFLRSVRPRTAESLEPDDVRTFLLSLEQRGRSTSTLRVYLSALMCFFHYDLGRPGALDTVPRARHYRKPPRPALTLVQVTAMLDASVGKPLQYTLVAVMVGSWPTLSHPHGRQESRARCGADSDGAPPRLASDLRHLAARGRCRRVRGADLTRSCQSGHDPSIRAGPLGFHPANPHSTRLGQRTVGGGGLRGSIRRTQTGPRVAASLHGATGAEHAPACLLEECWRPRPARCARASPHCRLSNSRNGSALVRLRSVWMAGTGVQLVSRPSLSSVPRLRVRGVVDHAV